MKRSIIFSGSDAKAANTGRKKDGCGSAGPFDKRNSPTTLAEGHTFSHFENWESKQPREHLNLLWEAEKSFGWGWCRNKDSCAGRRLFLLFLEIFIRIFDKVEFKYLGSPVTSLPIQSGFLKTAFSSGSSISAITNPSFSPRNSSTSR